MNDFRTFAIWLGRVLANALAGGAAFAVVGAFCGGGAVFVISLVAAIIAGGGFFAGVLIGAIGGFACGIAGVSIHLFAAFGAEPGDFWAPFFDLAAPVAFGQLWGTVGAGTAYLAFELIYSPLRGATFSDGINEHMLAFAVVAPITMTCGAIAGALLKRG